MTHPQARLSRGLLAAGLLLATSVASAQSLRIGLAEDPDVLDPSLARTFVGRIVFSAMARGLFMEGSPLPWDMVGLGALLNATLQPTAGETGMATTTATWLIASAT